MGSILLNRQGAPLCFKDIRKYPPLFFHISQLVLGGVESQLRIVHHLPVGQIRGVGNPEDGGIQRNVEEIRNPLGGVERGDGVAAVGDL